jgi:hypothetical protein
MTHQDAIQTMASERYLLGEMTERERDRFEEHYFDCFECADEIRLASVVREELAGGARPAAKPLELLRAAEPAKQAVVIRRDVPAWRRVQVALPWAVAASLAIVVGYQATGTPDVRPFAGTPVPLRGLTRSAGDVIVPLDSRQPTVVLMPDIAIDADAGAQLSWELRGPGGNTLVSERTTAPTPGETLMFVVPTGVLAPSGRHMLIVRNANSPDPIAEYAFSTVTR